MKVIPVSCRLAACVLVLGSCASAPEPTVPLEDPPVEAAGVQATDDPASQVAKAEVETLEFEIEIGAPVERVWDVMFSPEGYTQWTAPFMTGSYFEGSWEEGERIHFLAPGGSGMVAVIAANRTHELVSIKHVGYVWNGVEDTTSDGVRSWAPAYETYRFASVPGGTVVAVEQQVLLGYEDYMNGTWPRALAALKSLCEAD